MQIFVINLDRNPMRWTRMAGLLAGLNFKRIPAVDGKDLEGPEYNDPGRRMCYETLSRYNRACLLSHRAVCREFLAGTDNYCCVLEDDIIISPDFSRFVNNTDWIPADCDLMKIETLRLEIAVSTRTIPCLDRKAMRLRSPHLATAGYVISRRGAHTLLELTAKPDRSIDRILFEAPGLTKLPSYQLVPALCMQCSQRGDELIFPEMASTIQPKAPQSAIPARLPARSSVLNKIQRELFRPFHQFGRLLTFSVLRLQGIRRLRIPFA